MKNLFLIICFFGLGVVNVFSQSNGEFRSGFGVRSAVNANYSFLGDEGEEQLFMGPLIGAKYILVDDKNKGLMVEVNYSKLSYSSETTDYSFDYIHTPFFSRFSFPIGSTILSLNLGSYLQIILDHDAEMVYDQTNLFGLSGGIDFGFSLGRVVMFLEGRYNYNLQSNSETIGDLRSNWFEAGLGITLGNKEPDRGLCRKGNRRKKQLSNSR